MWEKQEMLFRSLGWEDALKMRNESEVAHSCLTLSDPMNCSLPGSSVYGIIQAKILEKVAMPSSRGFS